MYKYNYNKNYKNKKIFVNNIKKEILFNLFFNRFPQKLTVAKTKVELKKGKLLKNIDKKKEIFFNNEYIYYNKYTYNFLILDIDHKNYKINDFITILDENFISPPNWIIETNSGYQLGFILEKPFNIDSRYLSDKDIKAIKYAKYLQKKMLFLFNGDFNTNRLSGFWKNPMGVNLNKFKLFVNNKNFFNLSDFDIYAPIFDAIEEEKRKKKNKITQTKKIYENEKENKKVLHKNINKIKYFSARLVAGDIEVLNEIKEGFRNAFLWYIGMYLIKNNKNWEEQLETYNINLKKPLDAFEMEIIKNSIKKYTRQKKNNVSLGGYSSWTPELKNMYIKNYQKKKGITKYSREEQKEINKNKVLQAIYKLRSENKKLTNKNIAEYSGLGLTTVKKYKKILKEDPRFAVLFKK